MDAEAEEPNVPIRTIKATGKLRNGLFLRGVSLYEDRIAFDVFAVRALSAASDLADLRLTDNVGTDYALMMTLDDTIDGQSQIAFLPAPPPDASSLQLGQPGWGLHIVTYADSVPET